MKEIYFTIANGLLAMVLGLLSVFKDYRNPNPDRGFWEKIKVSGMPVIFVLILVFFVSLFAAIYSDKQKKRESKQNAQQQKAMTAEINRRTDSNRKVLFNDLSIALSRQKLKLDTVTKNLIELKDSAGKKVVNNFPEELPVLGILTNGILMEPYPRGTKFNISITSSQSGASNFEVKAYALIYAKEGVKDITLANALDHDTEIPKDNSVQIGIEYPFKREIDSLKYYLKGTYTGINSKIKRTIDEVYLFDPTTKKTYFYNQLRSQVVKEEIIALYKQTQTSK